MNKKSKTTTENKATTTNTLDPAQSSLLFGNVANTQAQAAANNQPYNGPLTAGFNPTQLKAQGDALDLASQHVGANLFGKAADAATAATQYRPPTVTGTGYVPTAAAATTVDRSLVRDVPLSAVSADAIKNYFDPYQGAVVDATAADLEHQRLIQQGQNTAAAIKGRAFGGSGAAVAQSLTDDSFARQLATTSAGLRSAGYSQALSAAQQDAARKQAADTSNQGVDLSVLAGNADRGQTTNLFNAGAQNTAAQFGAGQDQAAQIANQGAGLQGANLNLQGANLFGQIGNDQRSAAIGDLGLESGVGDAQQQQQQREFTDAYNAWLAGKQLSAQQQQLINQAIGLIPAQQTVNASGTSNSTTKTPSNILGTIANIGLAIATGGTSIPFQAAAAGSGLTEGVY